MKSAILCSVVVLVSGCGGSPAPAVTPGDRELGPAATAAAGSSAAPSADAGAAPESGKAASEAGASAAAEMATSCSEGSSSKLCLPPSAYAKALCNEDYPTLALAMFQKGTPWTRGYSVTRSAAWNASGGASSNEPMALHEELIVLRERKNTTGIEVSGASTSYDVVRWDGSCVTLQSGEFVFARPSKIANAPIVFKRLEEHVRDALKDQEGLRPTYLAHRRECKGATMGAVTKECEKLDGAFSRAIAEQVRERGGVPTPVKLPKR